MEHSTRIFETKYGSVIIDPRRDKKMAEVFERGEYPNRTLLELVGHFLTPKSVAVDIGAHIGTFALGLSKRAGSVVAFEPAPETYALLARNSRATHPLIDARNKGLSSAAGRASVAPQSSSNAGAHSLIAGGDIVLSTLDAEVERADFIKIDVEGMELEVLKGGTRVMTQSRPTVLFEVNLSQLRAHGASPRALGHYFKERGYRLYLPRESIPPTLYRVRSATLMTLFIAPRAFFLRSQSAPYDLLAVPTERALPLRMRGFCGALLWALKNNLYIKMRRLGSLVH